MRKRLPQEGRASRPKASVNAEVLVLLRCSFSELARDYCSITINLILCSCDAYDSGTPNHICFQISLIAVINGLFMELHLASIIECRFNTESA